MKPIQKQPGDIKLSCEDPQSRYFLAFARRESSKATGLHPSRGAKAAKLQNCTLRCARKQEINRIAPFARRECSKKTELYPSREAKAAKQPDCTFRAPRKPE